MVALTGVVAMVAAAAYSANEVVQLYFSTLYGAAFGLLLAATIFAPGGSPLLRALRIHPLQYLGARSYGIFLWHEPIMLELGQRQFLINPAPEAFPQNAIVLIVLSIAAAAASYRLVERPALDLFVKSRR